MATPKPESESGSAISSSAALVGVLALLAADREERLNSSSQEVPMRRTEVILADAGLTPAEIGAVLGKKPATVAKAISRARAKSQPSES